MLNLQIKLIEVEGTYKALVLDMSKETNRLVHIVEDTDQDVAWQAAQEFINMRQVVWQ